MRKKNNKKNPRKVFKKYIPIDDESVRKCALYTMIYMRMMRLVV